MLRSPNSDGKTYKVSMEILDIETGRPTHDGGAHTVRPHERTYRLKDGTVLTTLGDTKIEDIETFEEPPTVSTEKPYVGELSKEELLYLRSLPGKEYNLTYRFHVEEAGAGAKSS